MADTVALLLIILFTIAFGVPILRWMGYFYIDKIHPLLIAILKNIKATIKGENKTVKKKKKVVVKK